MGILFKTYNGKHQLHLYNEVWVFVSKVHLDELLSLFDKKELVKAEIKPVGNNIEVALNGLIMNCRNLTDVKAKFALLADMKEKYQKAVVIKKKA